MKLFLSAFRVLAMISQSARGEQWKLVWSDEFDYEGLPDKKKWDYEEGFVRNREMRNSRMTKGAPRAISPLKCTPVMSCT